MASPRVVLPLFVAVCCLTGSAGNLFAQPEAIDGKSPPFPPGNIRPTLLDFVTGMPISYRMQVASTPKLMRPPFAGQAVDKPKGLAYMIKADQVDVKNRVKAVRYLGKQDCMLPGTVTEPPKPSDAQVVLIKTMQSDKSEVVRYEAVKALENQLSRGPCGTIKRANFGRYENCLGCCNAKVLTALSDRAYGADAAGCPLEPSERVREACIQALAVCGIDCNYGPAPMPIIDGGENGIETKEIPVTPDTSKEAPIKP